MIHDGFTVHPGIDSPDLLEMLQNIARELRLCAQAHPDDQRLTCVEANFRWLLGERAGAPQRVSG